MVELVHYDIIVRSTPAHVSPTVKPGNTYGLRTMHSYGSLVFEHPATTHICVRVCWYYIEIIHLGLMFVVSSCCPDYFGARNGSSRVSRTDIIVEQLIRYPPLYDASHRKQGYFVFKVDRRERGVGHRTDYRYKTGACSINGFLAPIYTGVACCAVGLFN